MKEREEGKYKIGRIEIENKHLNISIRTGELILELNNCLKSIFINYHFLIIIYI